MGKKYPPSEKQIAYGKRIAESVKARRCIGSKWQCVDCQAHKPLSDYNSPNKKTGAIPSYCKLCASKRHKKWAEKHHAINFEKNQQIKVEKMKERKDRLLSVQMECGRCGKTKPREEWPIERGTARGSFPGKTRKYCCSAPKRTRDEVERDIAAGSKLCPSCDIRKSLSDFSPNKLAQDGRQTTCRSCRSAKVHSGEWNGNTRRQSLIDERSNGTITSDLIKQIFSIKICPCCDGYMDRNDKVLDHIIPLKLGGTHSSGNVMVMCRYCNSAKSAHHPSKWLQLLKPEAADRMNKYYNKIGLSF